MRPTVVADAPPAWRPSTLEKPPLGAATGAEFTTWDAHRSPEGDAALLVACIETPIPGWVEDMRPAIGGRTMAVAGAAVERITGVPVEAREDGDRSVLHIAGAPEGTPRAGTARTFLAFHEDHVATCFAVCASASSAPKPRGDLACDASVTGARIEGGTPPPAPGLVVGSVSWAVNHPLRSAAGGALLVTALGVLAVVARRKPRSRI